jgi:medium-chain acyl-[acyl-carrier-protein] hydrolase
MQERAVPDIRPLVAAIGDAIRPWLDVGFAFFGHSMGAFLAFEVCRRLRREGAPQPAHLIVSARPAPQLSSRHPQVSGLSDEAFTAAVLHRYQGIPPAILADRELMALFLPTIRADIRLVETYAYAPEEPLHIPLTALGGAEDPDASPEEIAAWSAMTRGRFAMHVLPGFHFFINTERAAVVDVVSRQLAPHLSPPGGGQ